MVFTTCLQQKYFQICFFFNSKMNFITKVIKSRTYKLNWDFNAEIWIRLPQVLSQELR